MVEIRSDEKPLNYNQGEYIIFMLLFSRELVYLIYHKLISSKSLTIEIQDSKANDEPIYTDLHDY